MCVCVCVYIYIYIANELEDSASSVNHLKFLCRLTLISNKIHLCFFFMKNDKLRDVSPGPVSENQPCNAEDSGSILGVRTKIPHATENLSKSLTTGQSMS